MTRHADELAGLDRHRTSSTTPTSATVVVGDDGSSRPASPSSAPQITADYAGRPPLLVGVLKGAFVFMADLARAIALPVEIDFMAVSSYGSADQDQRAWSAS